MLKRIDWQVWLGLGLIALSALVYIVHYFIFRDAHHIFIYLIGDIAFVFIEVLMVTLIIHRLLSTREKRAIMDKLNMVIGAFFSEVGTKLLKMFSDFDPDADQLREGPVVRADWPPQEFASVARRLAAHEYRIDTQKAGLENLQSFLLQRRDFLLRLLENPNLLEHESFTQLLWAVFHLADELAHRDDVTRLPVADYQHLAGDMQRAYTLLASEWLNYMRHLRDNYPYLFSLAMRTNPFDPSASIVLT